MDEPRHDCPNTSNAYFNRQQPTIYRHCNDSRNPSYDRHQETPTGIDDPQDTMSETKCSLAHQTAPTQRKRLKQLEKSQGRMEHLK